MTNKNKKHKPTQSFEPYLWSGEQVLWQSRPYASFGEYASQSPVELDSSVSQSVSEAGTLSTTGCLFNVFFFITFLGLMYLISDFGNHIAKDIDPTLQVILFLTGTLVSIFIALILAFNFVYMIQKYIFRIGEKRSAWYAVTNQRIYWRFRKTGWRYMLLPELYKVVIRSGKDGGTIEWHGTVPTRSYNPYGSQIPKIVFLGVYGADDLIAKVQELCQRKLLIADERTPHKAKVPATSIVDDELHTAEGKQAQARQAD